MARNIEYAHFDVDLLDNPKIITLIDEGGHGVFTGWLSLVLWARRVADPEDIAVAGDIPPAVARKLLAGLGLNVDQTMEMLERHRLVEPLFTGGWHLHEFAEHQDMDGWALRQQRNRKGGQARGKQIQAQAQLSLIPGEEPSLSTNPTQPNPKDESQRMSTSPSDADRRTRIPPDFWPDETSVKNLERHRPDVDWRYETKRFIAYWQAKPGKGGEKINWIAAWRIWMTRARGHARPDDWREGPNRSTGGVKLR